MAVVTSRQSIRVLKLDFHGFFLTSSFIGCGLEDGVMSAVVDPVKECVHGSRMRSMFPHIASRIMTV